MLAAAREMIKAGRAAACRREGSYMHHLANCGKLIGDPVLFNGEKEKSLFAFSLFLKPKLSYAKKSSISASSADVGAS